MRSERLKIWLGFATVSTVWGSTWMAIKIGLASIPPFFAAGARFAIASVLLWLVLTLRGQTLQWTPANRKIFLSLGLLSFSIPFALVYWGQQFIPSGLGSILFGTFPLCVALFSRFMLHDQSLDLYKGLGIVLGILGIAVIFWDDLDIRNMHSVLGMSAILVSVILQAYVMVLIKREGHDISPFAMNFVGMSIGTVLLLLLSAVAERGHPIRFDASAIGSLLYLSVVGSVVTFVTYYWLLKRVEAVYLSLTSFINPVVAVILGAVILGETMAPAVVAGSVLVLTGILVANGKSLYAKLRPLR